MNSKTLAFSAIDIFECPGTEFHPNRNSFDSKRSLRSLLGNLQAFGRQFCLYQCAGCRDRLSDEERENSLFWNGDLSELVQAFKRAHDAAGQLPENIYQHLQGLANGDCPVCAVSSALRQFPKIAAQSDSPSDTGLLAPCFWGRKTDKTGWNYDDNFMHIEALQCMSLDDLPPTLLPAEEYEIRTKLEPGKAILNFIDDHQAGRRRIPVDISDSDLWDILHWRPKVNTWGSYDIQPQKIWKQWAKKPFAGDMFGDSDKYICCLLQVAVDCYAAVSEKSQTIAYYYDVEGLHEDKFKQLFDAWLLLSGERGWFDFKVTLSNALFSGYLQKTVISNRFQFDGTYYALTFLGRKASRDLIGSPPRFVDAFEELWESTPAPKTASTNINKPVAQTAAAKVINAPENNSKLAIEVKEGAVQNNTTINNNMADPANLADVVGNHVNQAWKEALAFKQSPGMSGSTPKTDSDKADGMTATEFHEYMCCTYSPNISKTTAENIIKGKCGSDPIESIGTRKVNRTNAPTYPRKALIEAGETYANDSSKNLSRRT